ncbi:hypothetical protein LPC10_04600 [Methylorubrum sp. B1-46]|nr:hypothetical protein LPC10_04600 [Methylorubrum sp. B1-46]
MSSGAFAIPQIFPPPLARMAGVITDAEINVRAATSTSASASAEAIRSGDLLRGRPRSPGAAVLMVASAVCLVTGVGLAAQAHRFGPRSALAESLAGVLLILGLALIGFGLPVFR